MTARLGGEATQVEQADVVASVAFECCPYPHAHNNWVVPRVHHWSLPAASSHYWRTVVPEKCAASAPRRPTSLVGRLTSGSDIVTCVPTPTVLVSWSWPA